VKRVMFYCQHVLGMGHLVRSATRKFHFPDNIEVLQLWPLKSDAEFTSLQVCDPSHGLEETKEMRREQLLLRLDSLTFW